MHHLTVARSPPHAANQPGIRKMGVEMMCHVSWLARCNVMRITWHIVGGNHSPFEVMINGALLIVKFAYACQDGVVKGMLRNS